MNRVEKTTIKHRSKTNHLFVFKRFFNWRSYILSKIKEIEVKINRYDLIYKTGDKERDKTYNFQKFKTIKSFGREIYNDELTLEHAFEEQIKSQNEIDKFKESTKPQIKEKKVLTFESALRLLIGRQKVLNGFESKIFPIRKQTQEKGHPL